ncbi:MAG: EutN/CcmL family microcompartment protein [Ignavibacteriales bacterium]|nr:EutN/CcmL family microcompartment protein [Ignavibacteriales bacterium]
MILGKVIGSIVSTIKHDSYRNKKIMLVRPITPDGKLKSGTMVAIDTVRAGEGDTVLVMSEGRSTMDILELKNREPLRSIIVGVVDRVDIISSQNKK